MKFRNPANSHVEEVDAPMLWTLLLGPFYLAFKGAWIWAILCLFIPFAWLAVAFFAEDILRKQYLQRGWVEEAEEDGMQPVKKKRSAAQQRKLDEAARRTFGK